MGLEYIIILMEENIKEIINKINNMDLVLKNGMMDLNIKVNS